MDMEDSVGVSESKYKNQSSSKWIFAGNRAHSLRDETRIRTLQEWTWLWRGSCPCRRRQPGGGQRAETGSVAPSTCDPGKLQLNSDHIRHTHAVYILYTGHVSRKVCVWTFGTHQVEAAQVKHAELHVTGSVCGQHQLIEHTHHVSVQSFDFLDIQHTWTGMTTWHCNNQALTLFTVNQSTKLVYRSGKEKFY